MSISGPASSRWSRGQKPSFGDLAHLADQLVLGPGAALGSGRFGSGASAARQLVFDPAQLPLELLGARGHRPHRLDLTLALAGVCGRAMRALASFCSARRPSSCGSSSRRRASSSITSIQRPAASSPRRASAARTPSGSSRIRLRSSTPRRTRPREPISSESVISVVRHVLRPRARSTSRGIRPPPEPVCPTTMFSRHDRAGEAAVVDRVEDLFVFLLAEVEVRPLGLHAVRDAGRRALRADHRQRVAARAVFAEDHGPSVVGAALRDLDALGAAGARSAVAHASRTVVIAASFMRGEYIDRPRPRSAAADPRRREAPAPPGGSRACAPGRSESVGGGRAQREPRDHERRERHHPELPAQHSDDHQPLLGLRSAPTPAALLQARAGRGSSAPRSPAAARPRRPPRAGSSAYR